MRDDRRFIEWFGGLALSVWIGGLATIIVVAMSVFHELATNRGRAGAVDARGRHRHAGQRRPQHRHTAAAAPAG